MTLSSMLSMHDSMQGSENSMRPFIMKKAGMGTRTLGPVFPKQNNNPFFVAWQQSHLRNAVTHEFCYEHNTQVYTAVELIVQASTMDQYSIETASDEMRQAMEIFLYNISHRYTFDRLLRGIYRDLLINGNWYGRVKFVGKKPVAIHRVHFKQIVPDIPDDGGEIVTYSIFPLSADSQPTEKVPAKEMLHFTLNDMGDIGTGLSPLECLDLTLALDRYATEYQEGFFVNGVKAGDVFSAEPGMGPETYERDKLYLEAFTTPDAAHKPIFLSGKWNIIKQGHEARKDSDFLSLRNWNREEILSVYSVPMSLIATDKVGTLGSNGKQEDRELFMNAVIAPLQKQVFEDFNRQFIIGILNNQEIRLLPPGRPKVRLDDVKAAAEMIKVGFTGNEIRAALNLDLIEGMDQPLYINPTAAIIGIPGDKDSIFYTRMGPISGAPFELGDTVDDPTIEDPLGSENYPDPYNEVKVRNQGVPGYRQTGEVAGNQPTANTRSQANGSYKQNIVYNTAAGVKPHPSIPDNTTTNNRGKRNAQGTTPIPAPSTGNLAPPAKRKRPKPVRRKQVRNV